MEDEREGLAAQLGENAARFLATHHSPARARQVRLAGQGFDRAMWSNMAEQGWLALRLPEALGGMGLGLAAALPIAKAFGTRLVPDPLIDCALVPGALLAALPPSPDVARIAAALGTGEEVVAVAWQARPGQIEPVDAAVIGNRNGEVVHLTGRCLFVPPGMDRLLVVASVDANPAIVEVATRTISWQEIRLADGGIAGQAVFDGTPGRLLSAGPDATTAMALAVREGTVATAALLGALAERALEETIAYVRQRRQFDQALSEFQVIQHRLVDLRMQVMLAAASCRNAARCCEADTMSDAAASAISAAKARASDTALLVARASIQLHGAMGYTEEADIGLFLRAALRHAAAFGNASLHRARHLALARAIA